MFAIPNLARTGINVSSADPRTLIQYIRRALQLACIATSVSLGIAQPALAADAEKTMEENAQTLGKVKVEDSALKDASTDGTGYVAPDTTLGKDVRSLRETPQSITIVTRQQLTDQNINTIEGALKNVTGVTIQRYDAAGNYTQFMARGYVADIYQLDGLTLQTDANGIYFDLAAYDRVEVQRGTAGLYSGAGEPAVTVNIARKRATPEFKLDGALILSSWNDHRLEADIKGSLNKSGTTRGRAVGVYQTYDTYMDGIDDNKKKLFYGTIEQNLDLRTTLSVGVTWQSVDTVLSRGLPTWANGQLIDMPRSTMPVMDWNYQKLDNLSAFAELEHRGDDQSYLKLAARYVDRKNEAAYLDPSIPAADGTMTGLNASAFKRKNVDNSFDVYYSKPFSLAGQTQNILIGADYRTTDNDTHYAPYTTAVSGTVNLFNVTHHEIPEPVFDYNTNVSSTQVKSYGTYGQLRYKVTSPWTLVGGGRLSWWKSTTVTNGGTPASYDAKAEFTPYVATIVDLTSKLSTYASVNQIFQPQNALTSDNKQIDPRVGQQVEVGLKGEAVGGALQYMTAIYRLIDKNRAVTDPTNSSFSIASGKARAQGFEVDMRGQLSRQWAVATGYAFTETKYLRSTAAQQGQQVSTFTPKHSGNLWVHYTVDEQRLRGLELGAGVRSVSRFSNSSGNQKVVAPGYSVFSLSTGYHLTPKYKVTLNVDNLFDKTYWEKVSYPGRQNFFGEPRKISAGLRGSW